MNPVFIALVILLAVVIWFLLAFAFKPIGKICSKIAEDAFDQMSDKNEEEEKKDE